MANGDVVLERLEGVKKSLERALQGVEAEMQHRKPYETFTSHYLGQVSDLRQRAAALEDLVVDRLNDA